MWPQSTETQELLVQAKQGEPQAVERLLTKHRAPLQRMIGMRLDPALAARVDASDIVQDVLLEASGRLADYLKNPAMPFHLWLRHIAQDHLIDSHRRHRQAQRRSVDREQPVRRSTPDQSSLDLAAQFIDRELTPATAALRQEMEQRFQQILETLEEDEREILLMRHFEQLSNQEVSQALDISEAAASMRHLRALRRLKSQLGDKSGQPG